MIVQLEHRLINCADISAAAILHRCQLQRFLRCHEVLLRLKVISNRFQGIFFDRKPWEKYHGTLTSLVPMNHMIDRVNDIMDQEAHDFSEIDAAPSPADILHAQAEDLPQWLADDQTMHPPHLTAALMLQFFNSRVIYYPGAGIDGQAMKLFGGTHAAHCMVHADYFYSPDSIIERLRDPQRGCRGYRPIVEQQLTLRGLMQLVSIDETEALPALESTPQLFGNLQSLHGYAGLWTILERTEEYDESHGPKRLAFLHVQVDAVWLYWILWGRSNKSPYAIILQDHGFGGNWADFGGTGNSPLFGIASKTQLPDWLLVGKDTYPWEGYRSVSGWSERSGQHGNRRVLYRREV